MSKIGGYNGNTRYEDTLSWKTLEATELSPVGEIPLTPIEIGHRLWTSYHVLNKSLRNIKHDCSGTTASTTVYDGKGNLITATLGDSVSFAVVYDKQGCPLGVIRLNLLTHDAFEDAEKARIAAAGGHVYGDRVEGILEPSRNIGDFHCRPGVCTDASIDIINVDQIKKQLGIHSDEIGKIQIISTSDGFTHGAGNERQTKKDHETFLFDSLKKIAYPGELEEEKLAERLGSVDNSPTAYVPRLVRGIQ